VLRSLVGSTYMNAIWVGEVDGKTLVYDPTFQLPECPHLFLWCSEDAEMGKYIADKLRPHIKSSNQHPLTTAKISAYQIWRENSGSEWLKNARQYYEARRQREAEGEQQRIQREAEEEQQRNRRKLHMAELEIRKAETERFAKLTPEERHKETLEKLGKDYQGIRPATTNHQKRRITHCYSCKKSLDNSIDIECVVCSWIICSCGACGCGYDYA